MRTFDLQPDEQILWEGKPENFRTLDACHTLPLLRSVLIFLLGGALIGACAVLLSESKTLNGDVYAILLLFAIIAPLRLVLDAAALRRTRYYATDRRLVAVGKNVQDVAYSRIREAGFVTDAAGHTSLLCGAKALAGAPWSIRERTVVGRDALEGETTICDGFAFYAVDDADGLRAVLENRLPLSA